MTRIIDQLLDIAIKAGSEILQIYATEFSVTIKADNSPVTLADTAAEAIIVSALRAIAPDVAVIAEEAVSAGQIPEVVERFFLVDPLDGSKEFISRNGEFTVNIGLIEHGVPVAGVVYAPALGRIWWGTCDGGAFQARVVEGALERKESIRVRGAAPDGLDVVGSRSHGNGVEHWLEHFAVARFVPAGSSLKFCLVAAGEADLYPRLGRTMEWDTAAGDAILRAAGGRVETLFGETLRYGKRDVPGDCDFANPHFVAFGDPALKAGGAAHDR